MSIAFIGLGSNLNDPEQQIKRAIKAINTLTTTKITQLSSLYFSRPMGPKDQPDYMNAVAQISTSLSPLSLLDELQNIENKAGRIRKDNRWGPRVLDLDILVFDNSAINSERLVVPHYGLKEREFVLLPLLEIAPSLTLPCGDTIKYLSDRIDSNGLKVHSKITNY